MAGGPSTPELVAAVGAAGGLGIVPAGYLSAAAFAERLQRIGDATDHPWGVNLFLPGPPTRDPDGLAAHTAALGPWAVRYVTELGTARWDDDDVDAKVEVLAAYRPAVVTVTFGLPDARLVERLRAVTDAPLVVTVTTPEEAVRAEAAGADGLVLQGAEAGGHRGVLEDDPTDPAGGPLVPLLDLVGRARRVTALPLVATGGLMHGRDVRAVLDAGADAVQVGTALLATPEAGTSAVHRRALTEARYAGTTITRAFTGRPARGLANPLARAFPHAPSAYPEVHHLTRPLRVAAARADDPDAVHLWAGEGWRAITEEPAGDIVTRIAHDAGLEGADPDS